MEKDIFVELNFLIMIIDDALPKFDLPVDFVTDDSITGDILNQYGRFLRLFVKIRHLVFPAI